MAARPSLTISLARRADGAVVLSLRRPDGTTTWQKRTGPTAEFFAVHDLTHFAVETELGFERAFYGLVAEGWALTDFGTPWPRGPLPPEALPAEVIVGCFDLARASGERLTADMCHAAASAYFADADVPPQLAVTDDALDRAHARLSELVRRWKALSAGGALELEFGR